MNHHHQPTTTITAATANYHTINISKSYSIITFVVTGVVVLLFLLYYIL